MQQYHIYMTTDMETDMDMCTYTFLHKKALKLKGTIQRPRAILNTSDSEIMISEQSDWSVV